jgi:heat shock protein HslJ
MKKMLIALLALAVMLALGSVGCSSGPPHDSSSLDGTSWVLSTYGKSRPLPGTTITVVFEKGYIKGLSGCNHYSGSYRINGDRIMIRDLAATAMACLGPEGVMDQEAAYLGFLQSAGAYSIRDGQLQIFRSDGEALTFSPQN